MTETFYDDDDDGDDNNDCYEDNLNNLNALFTVAVQPLSYQASLQSHSTQREHTTVNVSLSFLA